MANDMNDGGIASVKEMPHALMAEQSVLGALMVSAEALDALAGKVVEADFYTLDHRLIFRAIATLGLARKPADVISVAQWLKDHDELERIGGFDYLRELVEGYGSVANLSAYASMVHDKAVVRAILHASMRMGELVYAPEGRSAAQLLDEAQALLSAVDERSKRGEGTFRTLAAALSELVHQIDDARHSEKSVGLPTGFQDLDRVMNPMMAGQLIVVGARPAVGKTSFAVNVAMHGAMAQGAAVGMFSMEMTDIEIAVRVLSGHTGMKAGRFREHRFNDAEWQRVMESVGKLSGANFHIDQTGGLSIQELTARARVAHKQVGGFGLLIVDYVQLSRSEGRHDNRAVELGAVTSGLKRLAKELGCPIMALSQLNRESVKANKWPTIAELRDSGSIESDADTILLLHRDYVVTQKPEDEFEAMVIIGKQRNGGIGHYALDYDATLTRFFDSGQAPGRRRYDGASGGDYARARGGER